MKKAVFILLVLFLIPVVLAVEINLKEQYQPKETFTATISGNFLDNIEAEDILFYSGRLYTPMIYDLAKIQDTYYIYSLLPSKERNYTLVIKNTHYLGMGGQEKKSDLKFDFDVSGPLSPFTVKPGFVITNKDFEVEVESNVKNLNIQASFLNISKQIEVLQGQKKQIPFSISGISGFKLTTLTLSADSQTYEIPVAIFSDETTEIQESKKFRFSRAQLNFTILKNQDFEFPLEILNLEDEDIKNITFNKEVGIFTITPETIETLEAGTSEQVIVNLKSDDVGLVESILVAKSGDRTTELFLSILITEDKEEFQDFIDTAEILEQESCSDIGGSFCDSDEECTGTTKRTIDGLCCEGDCKGEEGNTTLRTLLLVAIVIVILVIAFYVFKKLKARKASSKDVLKDRTKKYEERFKPQQIKGSLTKT